jgi:hypothetical protein
VIRNGREALLITPTSKIYLSYCEIKENKAALCLQGFNDRSPPNDVSQVNDASHVNGIQTHGMKNVLYNENDPSQSDHVEPLGDDHVIQAMKLSDSIDDSNMSNNLDGDMKEDLNGEGSSNGHVISNVIINRPEGSNTNTIKPEVSNTNTIKEESIPEQSVQDKNISIEGSVKDNSVTLQIGSYNSSMSR